MLGHWGLLPQQKFSLGFTSGVLNLKLQETAETGTDTCFFPFPVVTQPFSKSSNTNEKRVQGGDEKAPQGDLGKTPFLASYTPSQKCESHLDPQPVPPPAPARSPLATGTSPAAVAGPSVGDGGSVGQSEIWKNSESLLNRNLSQVSQLFYSIDKKDTSRYL